MNNNNAKIAVEKLVRKYEEALKSEKTQKYTEEETKKDFILPLFEALGWDTINREEVSAEEHIKSSGRVDYGFYINNKAKFYLEAKPFRADIENEDLAKQAIRYSWNKGITYAVLTNFETIKLFNAQAESKQLFDKLIFEIPCLEYIKRFDDLYLLSKEALSKGSLDEYAEKHVKKFTKVTVNEKLFKDLKTIRENLTKSFRSWNDELKKPENAILLDEGVQKVIDRLVFIKVIEDKELEPPILIPLVREWENTGRKIPLYQLLVQNFHKLNDTYNSDIFSPHVSDNWGEHEGAVKDAIKLLQKSDSIHEYDFKYIPADILGGVYESYLGYIAQKGKGKTGEEEKSRVKRKEHGIYYTPRFIVDYIVEQTLGKVLENTKSIDDLKKIKVLDPACGSGSFLVKALDLINERYKYFGNRGDVYTKSQILLENIYGVDLDSQAIELARLNLLINTVDGKTKLPNLTGNIKVGNSLISGTDEELREYFGKNFRDKIPFNWQEEFPTVFEKGGFDVIIGNPPYISAIQDSKSDLGSREFYRKKFSLKGAFDIYAAFLMIGVQLTKKDGSFGWIVPNKLMVAEYAKDVKNMLLKNGLHTVVDISKLKVFDHVGVYPVIIIGSKTRSDFTEYEAASIDDLLIGKISPMSRYSQYATFKDLGLQFASGATGFQAKMLIKHLSELPDKETIPFAVSGCVDPYRIHLNRVRYMGHNYKYAYIKMGEGIARSKWKFWNNSKIVISGMTKRLEAQYFKSPLALGVGVYAIFKYNNLDPHFLLAVLNSQFLTYYLREKFKHKHLAGGYLAINKSTLEQLPLVKPDSKTEILLSDLAKSRISLTDEFYKSVENSNEWQKLKNEIAKLDHKIDEEVYKLYNLTPEQIKIVENSII